MKENENNKVAEIFARLMVERIEKLNNEDWSQPWFNVRRRNDFNPRNYKGNVYRGGNAFILTLLSLEKDYRTPVFLTFKQALEIGVSVNKGEKSNPVYFKNYAAFHKENKNIRLTPEEYYALSGDERKKYKLVFFLRLFHVFNLEQTNFAVVKPGEWMGIVNHYIAEPENPQAIENGFISPLLDEMLLLKSWCCPVETRIINKAYFSPSQDIIVLPDKKLFKSGEKFYGTLLHEMAHSTGTEKRLNRNLTGYFGSDSYAIEELIAEFSAAFTGFKLGIFAEPDKNNAAYLKSWLKILRESPKYIFNILDNAVSASQFILEMIGFEKSEILEEERENG